MANLLVVEDDYDTNEAISEYMKMVGHSTLSAFDGVQAIITLQENNVDLVILDIMLPKKDGISEMCIRDSYTIVDTIFVSRFVNTNALSAINIVCPVINLIVGLGTMIATGGSAIVARKMGAGEPKRAKQDFTLLILFGFILGVVIFILGIIFIDEIIYALGAVSYTHLTVLQGR